MLTRQRSAVLFLTMSLLALPACSDSDEDTRAAPGAAASAPAAAAPGSVPPAAASSAPGSPAPAPGATASATGRPEIVTNPDGTVNSGGPRPATSASELTAGGLGPYKIGIARKDLESAKLVGKVTPIKSDNCTGYATAKGVAKYHGPLLVFYDGRLLRLTVTNTKVKTDQGVTIGSTMSDVRKRYPAGKQIDDWTGRGAWLATVGDYGLLFDVRDDKVAAVQAGMAEPMQYRYTDRQGC
jgi:hypothetical protein